MCGAFYYGRSQNGADAAAYGKFDGISNSKGPAVSHFLEYDQLSIGTMHTRLSALQTTAARLALGGYSKTLCWPSHPV